MRQTLGSSAMSRGLSARSRRLATFLVTLFAMGACNERRSSEAAVERPQGKPDPSARPEHEEPLAAQARAELEAAGLVVIVGGRFRMGSDEGGADERPVHEVSVPTFALDRTEVTVEAYEACVKAGACTVAGAARPTTSCNAGQRDRKRHPINCVDWNQASAYCASAGKRLPTEEEWEYASRGADGRTFPWGNAPPSAQVCWNGEGRAERTTTCEVGAFPSGASPFGVLDMAGNVWEWTSSAYSEQYGNPPIDDRHVYRGGSFYFDVPSGLRASARSAGAPSVKSYVLGFRCARSLGGG